MTWRRSVGIARRWRLTSWGNRAMKRERVGGRHRWVATIDGNTSTTATVKKRVTVKGKRRTVPVIVHTLKPRKKLRIEGAYTKSPPWTVKRRRRRANQLAKASRKANR